MLLSVISQKKKDFAKELFISVGNGIFAEIVRAYAPKQDKNNNFFFNQIKQNNYESISH